MTYEEWDKRLADGKIGTSGDYVYDILLEDWKKERESVKSIIDSMISALQTFK